ncbi:MAG: PCRF domain-containing protein, partial [Rikenellaceae bacterium]
MISADQIRSVEERRAELERCLGIDNRRIELQNEEERTQEPNFWDAAESARKQLQRVSTLKSWVDDYESVAKGVEDLQLMGEFVAAGVTTESEYDDLYATVVEQVEALELRNMLRRKFIDAT